MSATPADDVVPSPVPLLLREEASNASRAVRAGALRRVTRGVYAPAAEWDALPPWHRYLARVHAVARTQPDAVFVLESAAALRGLPVFGEPADVHVVVGAPSKARSSTGVRFHSTARPPRSERLGGIRLACADEVAMGIACARHPAVGLAVAAAALRADATLSPEALRDLALRRPTRRGMRTADWVFSRATAATESPLEDVSLAVIEWLGFAAPTPQCWFRGAEGDDRVDFLWRIEGIAGEADGDVKYSGVYGDAREALRARRSRDARLHRHGLTAVAHWGWADVTAAAQLRAVLLAAGLAPSRPENTAPLCSLRAALHPPRPARPG